MLDVGGRMIEGVGEDSWGCCWRMVEGVAERWLRVWLKDGWGCGGKIVEGVVEGWQGWECAHMISELIARFLSKNEQMTDSLKKMSNSLIRSFLVS